MKVLVYPHKLDIGGVQIVSTELAAAVKDLGHDVVVFAPPGPLAEVTASRGVRVIAQDLGDGRRPSRKAVWDLREVARKERVDVVHAQTHTTSLEAFFGTYTLSGLPLVCSDGGVRLPDPFPGSLPFIACNAQLEEEARRAKRGPVYLLEPPIDTERNHPSVDGSQFRREYQLSDGRINVVMVSRLEIPLKGEGLVRAVEAATIVSEYFPLRLVIVGGGLMYQELREKAEEINKRLQDRIIVTTGPILDPRPAYAAADIVVGMGTSILRGMAFAKPAICVGLQGFSEVVMPSTMDHFRKNGFFGMGNGGLGADRLPDQLTRLLSDESLREELGRFSREVACQRFSLSTAARRLERIYEQAISERPSLPKRISEATSFLGRVGTRRVRRGLQRRHQLADASP